MSGSVREKLEQMYQALRRIGRERERITRVVVILKGEGDYIEYQQRLGRLLVEFGGNEQLKSSVDSQLSVHTVHPSHNWYPVEVEERARVRHRRPGLNAFQPTSDVEYNPTSLRDPFVLPDGVPATLTLRVPLLDQAHGYMEKIGNQAERFIREAIANCPTPEEAPTIIRVERPEVRTEPHIEYAEPGSDDPPEVSRVCYGVWTFRIPISGMDNGQVRDIVQEFRRALRAEINQFSPDQSLLYPIPPQRRCLVTTRTFEKNLERFRLWWTHPHKLRHLALMEYWEKRGATVNRNTIPPTVNGRPLDWVIPAGDWLKNAEEEVRKAIKEIYEAIFLLPFNIQKEQGFTKGHRDAALCDRLLKQGFPPYDCQKHGYCCPPAERLSPPPTPGMIVHECIRCGKVWERDHYEVEGGRKQQAGEPYCLSRCKRCWTKSLEADDRSKDCLSGLYDWVQSWGERYTDSGPSRKCDNLYWWPYWVVPGLDRMHDTWGMHRWRETKDYPAHLSAEEFVALLASATTYQETTGGVVGAARKEPHKQVSWSAKLAQAHVPGPEQAYTLNQKLGPAPECPCTNLARAFPSQEYAPCESCGKMHARRNGN